MSRDAWIIVIGLVSAAGFIGLVWWDWSVNGQIPAPRVKVLNKHFLECILWEDLKITKPADCEEKP